MKRVTLGGAFVFVLSLMLLPHTTLAFEEWKISDIFSSSDGRFQYIALSTSANNQGNLTGRAVTARNPSGVQERVFVFPAGVAGPTANRTILLGTAALAQATGIAMDYVIPEGFLFTEGGSVNYANVQAIGYQDAELPKNGLQSLRPGFGVAAAMPVNFNGQSASVEVPVLSWFDGTTALLYLPVVDVAGLGIVNATLRLSSENPLEFSLHSAYVYVPGIQANPTPVTVAENGQLYVPGAVAGNEIYEFTMSLIDNTLIVFGNPVVHRVTLIETPVTPPDPAPPPPTPLELSINAGQQIFAQMCASCHGPQGNGTQLAPSVVSSSLTSFEPLRAFINANMPFRAPSQCVDNAVSSCATDVSNFIIHRLRATGNIVVNY